MKVGTIKTIAAENVIKKKRAGLSGGFGSNGGGKNGGGGGDNGGGDDKLGNQFDEEIQENPRNKFRILMWFLLLVVMMTFGGLIAAYVVVATNGVLEWQPFALPKQIWISTVLILASSVAYQISLTALRSEKQEKAKNWLLAATVLGGIFISSQILVWLELVNRGVYMQSNPYAGFFYILTAVHAVHVLGGIIALGFIVLLTWQKTGIPEELERRKNLSGAIGWYWHFMDVLWIALVVLLGFYK